MLHDNSSYYTQSKLKENTWILPLQEILVHLHWDRDEIMPWYYVMILGVTYSFHFGPCVNLLKDHMV